MNKDKVFLNHILDEIDFLADQFKDLDFQDLMKVPKLEEEIKTLIESESEG